MVVTPTYGRIRQCGLLYVKVKSNSFLHKGTDWGITICGDFSSWVKSDSHHNWILHEILYDMLA